MLSLAPLSSTAARLFVPLCSVPPFSDPPFHSDSQPKLFTAIKRGAFSMKGERWDNVSDEGKSFIRRLLDVRPATRLSAPDMLRHPWLKQEDSVASNRELTGTVDEIRRFNTRRKLRAGFLQVRPMPVCACLYLPMSAFPRGPCITVWPRVVRH